jgi:hypothetical protein
MKHVGELGREAIHDGTVIPVRSAPNSKAVQTHILKTLQITFAAGPCVYSPGSADSCHEDVARSHLMRASVALYIGEPSKNVANSRYFCLVFLIFTALRIFTRPCLDPVRRDVSFSNPETSDLGGLLESHHFPFDDVVRVKQLDSLFCSLRNNTLSAIYGLFESVERPA